jgi:peptide/nickel transport system permease protein
MIQYVIRRFLQMIPILIGVTLLIFLLLTFSAEDPARIALGSHATPEKIASLRAKWGLDKPLLVQYLQLWREILTADFGRSFVSGERLSDMFKEGALVSLSVTLPPFVMGTVLNLCVAMLVAWYRGSMFDRFMSVIFTACMSVSYLVYVILFQYFLAFNLDLFEINGFIRGIKGLPFLFLPWLILIIVQFGPDVRLYRSILLEETKADYVRTARAKGLSEKKVMFKHVLKNAMIPVMTHTVVVVPFLVMGSFVLERYFSIPGIGDLLVSSVNTGDFPVIKGVTVMSAVAYSLFNLITDVLYAAVDPRVKLS